MLDPFAPNAHLSAALARPAPMARIALPARKRTFDQLSTSQTDPHSAAHSSQAAEVIAVSSQADCASAPAVVAAAPPSLLSSDDLSVLANLRTILHNKKLSEDARASRAAQGLKLLLSFVETSAMIAACEAIDAPALTDEAILCACQAAALPDVSSRAAAAFVHVVLLPRLQQLEQPASRTLFSSLLSLMKHHARPLLEALVVPIMWSRGGQLSAGQVEALQRLLKEAPEALMGKVLFAFLQGEEGNPAGWTEAQAALLQILVSRKPTLEAECVAEVVVQADANVDALRKSLKFSNFLSTLVRSYGPQLRPHLAAVSRIAERLDTFMKKAILVAIGKL